jgi:tetratricopeptide (TPR) repeat protein
MSSGENAQTWLARGAEAYANMHIEEARQHFEQAVAANPDSAQAHLSLGVICFFLYNNSVAEQPDLMDDERGAPRWPTREELQTKSEQRRAQTEKQNATNGAQAEAHLQQALQLEPNNEPAMEYLAALCFWWRDPATGGRTRQDEARQWYARIAEIHPQHRFANYLCGVIDCEKASAIVHSAPGYPRPLAEESRRSLRAQVGSLLDHSAANFLRSLEIEPGSTDSMTFLGTIRNLQAFIAETIDDSVRLRAEAAEWYQKVHQRRAAQANAAGQTWPPGASATMTFHRLPGKPPIPPFPPDARVMIPPAPPPPPPAFTRGAGSSPN